MNQVLQQILKICEEKYLGPNRMDRKHIIEHCNNALTEIKSIIENSNIQYEKVC